MSKRADEMPFILMYHLPQLLDALEGAGGLKKHCISATLLGCSRHSELLGRGGRDPMSFCVSALDELVINIQRPRLSDAPNPVSYCNEKNFFAVNCQAAVGADFQV